jgi:hypothetical protein
VYALPMMQTEVSFMFSPGWHQAKHLGLGIDGDEEQVLVAVATLVVGQHLMRVWPLAR